MDARDLRVVAIAIKAGVHVPQKVRAETEIILEEDGPVVDPQYVVDSADEVSGQTEVILAQFNGYLGESVQGPDIPTHSVNRLSIPRPACSVGIDVEAGFT
jgi:hypothetical protein